MLLYYYILLPTLVGENINRQLKTMNGQVSNSNNRVKITTHYDITHMVAPQLTIKRRDVRLKADHSLTCASRTQTHYIQIRAATVTHTAIIFHRGSMQLSV